MTTAKVVGGIVKSTVTVKIMEKVVEDTANHQRVITLGQSLIIKQIDLTLNLSVPQVGETWEIIGTLVPFDDDSIHLVAYGLVRVD